MSVELLPCPFCGGIAIVGMFNVWCAKCEAQTKKDVDSTVEEKLAAWNTRTPHGEGEQPEGEGK